MTAEPLVARKLQDVALATTAHTAIVLTPRPFARSEDVELVNLPEGLTLADMVDALEATGQLDVDFRPWVRVTVGDQVVPAELWKGARPKAGVTVFIDIAPRGSNPVRTLLTIAVIAVSVWTAGVATAAFGSFAGALAAAAVGVAGSMLVNAIAPIPQPKVADQKARVARYSLNGASNAARPHDPIPIVLGRRRIYPPRAANWYTTTVDNTVYLRQLFQPSQVWLDRASPKLGETALDDFDGVTVRWNTKPTDGLSFSYFAETPAEDSLGPLPLKVASGWTTRAAPIEADRISLDVGFLNGLFDTDSKSGALKNRTVDIEVRYGLRGTGPDASAPAPIGMDGVLSWTRNDADTWREEFSWSVARGLYDVHLRRISEEATSTSSQDEVSWICVRAFRSDPPIRNVDNAPWIELELKATEQLSGVPDNFNFVATSMVPQAMSTGPGALIATRNPADLFLAGLYAPLSDIDLDDDERRFEPIAAWRALCVERDWKCDLVEEGEVSVSDLLVRIAACGRARPSIDYGAVTVIVDWAKPKVRQMFTPRNVQGFQGELIYPEEVHGLRLRFQNEEKGYEDDTITVFAPGYTEETASQYDSIEVRDKTDPDEVEWEGARTVGERIARPERFTFQQDVEYIAAVEGDRCYLSHHVALIGQVSGRVMEIVSEGGLTGVRLDEAVIMEEGKSYDLAWRAASDDPTTGIAGFTATLRNRPGERTVVLFETTPAHLPVPGELATMGEHLIEVLDVIVDRITPKAGLMAEISCIPYAPELMDVGETPITSYRSNASLPPALPGAYMPPRDVETLRALLLTAHAAATNGWQIADQAFSDGVLTPGEKRQVVPAIKALIQARAALRARADDFGLTEGDDATRDAYEAACDTLDALLAGLTTPVAWDDSSDKTTISDPAAFSAAFQACLQTERNLQTRLDQIVKALVDDVATSVDDGVINKGEKVYLIGVIKALIAARTALRTEADASGLTEGVSDVRDAYEAACDALDAVLATLTTPTAWDDPTGRTIVPDPAAFRVALQDAQTTEKNLQTAIAGAVRVVTGLGDTTPPAAPTNLVVSAAFQSIIVTWDNPADLDLAKVEVWESATSTRPDPATQPGARVALVDVYPSKPGLYVRSGLSSNTAREYWVRAVDRAGNVSDWNAADGVGATTATLDFDAFASSIKPVGRGSSLPTASTYSGDTFFNTSDGRLYRKNTAGNAWVYATPTTDLSGQISSTQITDGSITTPKLVTGAVTANELASNSVTAIKIAAAQISASHIASATITGDKIAAGTLTATNIQAGSLTGDRLAAATIYGGLIVADTLQTNHLVGAAVTGIGSDEQAYGNYLTTSAVQVFSLPYTTTVGGAPHLIFFGFHVGVTAGPTAVGCRLVIKRDGLYLTEVPERCEIGWDTFRLYVVVDAPSAGGHTYTLEANATAGSGAFGLLYTTNMVIMERKR